MTLAAPDVEWAYRRYFPALRQKCLRMLADPTEAQDVAQEAFTRLWERRLDLRDVDRVTAWLYRTSTRLAVDRLRARRRAVHTDIETPGSTSDAPDRVAESRQILTQLAQSLSREHLELLVLWRVDGLEQSEIAELLGTSERTVRRRLSAAKTRLERLGGTFAD